MFVAGIGKTAVVQQMAKLLGVLCERINMSANTTLDQLLGSYIPKVVDGQRVFAWHDGVLMRAIRNQKVILFDEINLAPPEVLAAIAPLLDRCGHSGCTLLLCNIMGSWRVSSGPCC